MGDRSYAGARLGFAPKGWMHSEARPNNGAFWRSLTRRPLHSCPPGRGATASWCYLMLHVDTSRWGTGTPGPSRMSPATSTKAKSADVDAKAKKAKSMSKEGRASAAGLAVTRWTSHRAQRERARRARRTRWMARRETFRGERKGREVSCVGRGWAPVPPQLPLLNPPPPGAPAGRGRPGVQGEAHRSAAPARGLGGQFGRPAVAVTLTNLGGTLPRRHHRGT